MVSGRIIFIWLPYVLEKEQKITIFSVVNRSEIAIIEKRLADEKREEGIWGKQGIVKEGVLITCAMLIVSAAVYFFLVAEQDRRGKYLRSCDGTCRASAYADVDDHIYLKCCTADGRFSLYREGIWAKTIYTSLLLPVFLWDF